MDLRSCELSFSLTVSSVRIVALLIMQTDYSNFVFWTVVRREGEGVKLVQRYVTTEEYSKAEHLW